MELVAQVALAHGKRHCLIDVRGQQIEAALQRPGQERPAQGVGKVPGSVQTAEQRDGSLAGLCHLAEAKAMLEQVEPGEQHLAGEQRLVAERLGHGERAIVDFFGLGQLPGHAVGVAVDGQQPTPRARRLVADGAQTPVDVLARLGRAILPHVLVGDVAADARDELAAACGLE